MERRTVFKTAAGVLLAFLFLVSCDSDAIVATDDDSSPYVSTVKGVKAEELNFVRWNAEARTAISSLNKLGDQTKLIQSHVGGTIGGHQTFGNNVEIPAGALAEDTWISVNLACMDGKNVCGAEVDYTPDGQFLVDVKVTLSWEALDFDGDPDALNIYWYNVEEDVWVKVDNPEIDPDAETVSVYIDHFTRYAWVL